MPHDCCSLPQLEKMQSGFRLVSLKDAARQRESRVIGFGHGRMDHGRLSIGIESSDYLVGSHPYIKSLRLLSI